MKLFISWSGERSRQAASVLGDWLKSILPALEPWSSPQIPKGHYWFPTILERLNEAKLGLAIVTADNDRSPWLLYEIGVMQGLGKAPGTFLLDHRPEELTGPLAQINHTPFKKADIIALCSGFNTALQAAGESHQTAANLSILCENGWPKLEEDLGAIREQQHQMTGFEELDEIRTRLLHIQTAINGRPVTYEDIRSWGLEDYGPQYLPTVADLVALARNPMFIPQRLRATYPDWDWNSGKMPWDSES